MDRKRLVPVLIALAVFAAFLPVLSNGFVNWDDEDNFTRNPSYRGLSGTHLKWMFGTFLLGHYQPLSWMTLGLDYLLWGMDARGYHLTSLLLHVANAALFYFLLRALLERIRPGGPRLSLAAALGALFFALHPLRVESVAWATERKDVLCGFFFLLSLLAYLRMEREQREGRPWGRWLAASTAFFTASLFSKALGLLLPAALLVLDVYPLQRIVPGKRRAVLLEKLPFAAASLAAGLVALVAAGSVKLVRTEFSVVDRVMQSSYGLCFYLWKTVLPLRLCALYPIEPNFDPWRFVYVACFLVAVGITAALVALRHRFPAGLAAWSCYVLLLIPLLGIVLSGPQIVADRYTYLSCLPWAVLAAAGLYRMPTPRTLVPAAAILVVFALLTFVQARTWKDSLTLWNHALEIDPDNYHALNNRAIARAAAGDPKGALADQEQLAQLAHLDATEPSKGQAAAVRLNNAGNAKASSGDFDGAIADYTRAIEIEPKMAGIYNNRGNARASKGDHPGAIADYTEALKLDAASFEALYNRGKSRAILKDHPGALEDYTAALQINPRDPDVRANRGNTRLLLGDRSGALGDWRQALHDAPPGWPHREYVAALLQKAAGR